MSPEKHLLDWQTSQTIAETISPLLGQLYREKGVEVLLFGKTLVNAATIDIIKTHRLARRYTGTPLSAEQTLPLIKALSEMELSPCRIDVGQLAHQFWKDRDDEHGVVEFAVGFEPCHDLTDFAIESLDFEEVVADVAADLRHVGHASGHVDEIRIHPGFDAAVELVRAVRILTAEPETHGRIGIGTGGDELVEVLVAHGTGWIGLTAPELRVAGPPPLSGVSHVISGRIECIGVGDELDRQGAPQIAAFAKSVHRST